MSCLSSFDSEAVGFDSASDDKKPMRTNSSQTTEFSEGGMGSQTHMSKDIGCLAQPEDIKPTEAQEYPPPGLNEFLRRVVPAMMDQLDQNNTEFLNNSSDSDEEEVIGARLFQEMQLRDGIGAGDHETSILGVTWSSAGNSLAVSIGQLHHETFCQTSGIIKVFTLKRSEDKFVHSLDISENNCVTVLKYHPNVAALLAYGTTSGEVVLCNLRNGSLDEGTQLTSPAGCHGSRRVSGLQWADAPLANIYLLMQIHNKGKRRGAADQVLFSSGCDGTLNAWQVNSHSKVFENIICYNINGSKKVPVPDITCFDFFKSYPLRSAEEKSYNDVFVVGARSGQLFLCKVTPQTDSDPVYEVLQPHGTCVLDVSFSFQRPGIFVSISTDSEVRVYDINQNSPLRIICLDIPICCMSWLCGPCVVLGLAGCDELLRVYNICSGRAVPVSGLAGNATVTCVAVNQSGSCRIAAGDGSGALHLYELPSRRMRLTAEDLDF
ncbi:WD repeat-containing protein 34 [Danaus plexippus plexippus]|uniref:WD repeat-containing protein 34 n=1 Tax=Danaus plexippus plexippus TaxID=278856 RepID=A0A212EQ12_DANPL|nr:WD repeat-containing protein 34 [Danaus plexippus plexippus]